MIGFALETENLKENALKKLKQKDMDLIIANRFESVNSETTSAVIIDKNSIKCEIENYK